jgi:ATP-dependent 26S proteasome regulatory subunit
MTSNRASTIDPAFQSRVHLTLHYPNLDSQAKKHIWTQFTTSLKHEHELTAADLEDLSHLDLNGRQIKNVVKISMLLATRHKVPLNRQHIDTVLEATQEPASSELSG